MNFTNDDYPEIEYTPEMALKIKGALFELLKECEKTTCVTCGKHLDLNHAFIYDHYGGWDLSINGLNKQWVSILCECGYHNSINKLGVLRNG